jgi:hypothetical protein
MNASTKPKKAGINKTLPLLAAACLLVSPLIILFRNYAEKGMAVVSTDWLATALGLSFFFLGTYFVILVLQLIAFPFARVFYPKRSFGEALAVATNSFLAKCSLLALAVALLVSDPSNAAMALLAVMTVFVGFPLLDAAFFAVQFREEGWSWAVAAGILPNGIWIGVMIWVMLGGYSVC